MVDGLAAFSGGTPRECWPTSRTGCGQASERQEFELAARNRDRIDDVRRALLRQEVVTEKPEDFDLIAFHGDDLESAFQMLHVRRGRVVGRRGVVVDRVEELTDARADGPGDPPALRGRGAPERGPGLDRSNRSRSAQRMAEQLAGLRESTCECRRGAPSAVSWKRRPPTQPRPLAGIG